MARRAGAGLFGLLDCRHEKRLRAIAAEDRSTLQDVLVKALEHYRREKFVLEANAAHLRAAPHFAFASGWFFIADPNGQINLPVRSM